MSGIKCVCPFCLTNTRVSEHGAGKTLRCPHCGKKYVVPYPRIEVEIIPFGNRRGNGFRPYRLACLSLAACLLIFLAAGALVYFLTHGTLERDYFVIQELTWEIAAVYEFANFLNFAEEGHEEEASQAHDLITVICRDKETEMESLRLAEGKSLVERHRVSVNDAALALAKRFPEGAYVRGEVLQMTEDFARERLVNVLWPALHNERLRLLRVAGLTDKREKELNLLRRYAGITDKREEELHERFLKFQQTLLKREIPRAIDELRAKVRDLPRIKKIAVQLSVVVSSPHGRKNGRDQDHP